MNNDLISREALKEDFDCVGFNDYDDYNRALRIIDNAPTIHHPNCDTCEDKAKQYTLGFQDGLLTGKEMQQGKWFENITKGLLKARHGDYVLYKVDFLLDNLSREVNIMESARRMKGGDSECRGKQ